MMKKRLKLLCLVVSVITGGWLALYGILTVLAKHASNAVLSQSEGQDRYGHSTVCAEGVEYRQVWT